MLLRAGHWVGKGSLILQGMSLGETLSIDAKISDEPDAVTINGSISIGDSAEREMSIRVVPNEVGTYTLDVFVDGTRLDGIGKMDSEPHAGLLWHETHPVQASVAIFSIPKGIACRGFVRDEGVVRTWEIAFATKQSAAGGSNVVSLSGRRKR